MALDSSAGKGLLGRAIAASVALTVVFGVLAFVDTLGSPVEPASNALLTTGEVDAENAEHSQLRVQTPAEESRSELLGDQDDENAGDGDAADPEAGDPASVGSARPSPSADAFEPIRNVQEKFTRFQNVPSDQLSLDDLLEPAPRNDNGSSPEGQFRLACEYSHFAADDPIIFPGEPGRAHLHLFFGNTRTDANTTKQRLLDQGGSTCNGFELNRSAYWVPALLDGKGNAVVPDTIIIYYKTKRPDEVQALPQGLQMIAGNIDSDSFEATGALHWSCGESGTSYNKSNRIPDCGGDTINAAIQFPNCWNGELTSSDFTSHLLVVNEQHACPGSHPNRLPQISFLIYWPGADSVDGWHLSSDNTEGFNGPPGGTLHADWLGGWNDEAIELWTENCLRKRRNCSFGQTGTSRQFASLNKLQRYEGDNFLPLP